jgi:hypothetical protein
MRCVRQHARGINRSHVLRLRNRTTFAVPRSLDRTRADSNRFSFLWVGRKAHAKLGSGSLRSTHAIGIITNDKHRGERMRHHFFRTFPDNGVSGLPRSWHPTCGPAK